VSALAASEAYRLWAPTYERENVITTLECALIDELSPSPQGLHLLDVGCGTGRRLVGTDAARAVGVEPCAEMLSVGRRAHEFGPEVEFVEADARALPLSDSAFDLVWCRLMIGHLPACEPVYRELARVARPHAHVVVSDFHPAAAEAGLRRTFRDREEVVEVEHYVHTAEQQIAAAAAAGLVLMDRAEGKVGPRVRPFYADARKESLYAEQRGRPMVLALSFARDG
jgi:ubiquinone/menaquinone biosynthesis C-methylase UbiE